MAPKVPQAVAVRRKAKAAAQQVSPVWAIRLLSQLGVLAVLLAGYYGWQWSLSSGVPADVTPFKGAKMKSLPEFNDQYKESMLWGSYRSGLYFGMRTRLQRPLKMGLMWFDPDSYNTVMKREIFHEANQGDGLRSYGWLRHDGRSYGRQQLLGKYYNITLNMVKYSSSQSGTGGDWAVRITTSKLDSSLTDTLPKEQVPPGHKQPGRRLSLLIYMADTHWRSSSLDVVPEGDADRVGEGVMLAGGDNEDLGPWALSLLPGQPSKRARAARLHHLGVRLNDGGQLVMLKDLALQALLESARREGSEEGLHLHLPNIAQPSPNLAVFQVTFPLPTSLDLVYLSDAHNNKEDRIKQLSGDSLTKLIQDKEAAFDAEFDAKFPLQPSAAEACDMHPMSEVAKAALSNLLGSMGFFYGASRVQLPGVKPKAQTLNNVVEYWRDELFTATPSRSFFPRGFLWDEGFHQSLIQRWDPQISRDAIAHWLDLMNVKGWIPREQILGKEARARVPAEFVVQHPTHANPPSLFLPLLVMAENVLGSTSSGSSSSTSSSRGDDSVAINRQDVDDVSSQREFLIRAWPRLEAWYGWFNTTQAGQLAGSYRWHGRNATTNEELNPKTLVSGLDDYPRSSHPTDDERHVDLLCWMAFASHAMAHISQAAGMKAAVIDKYAAASKALGALSHIKQLHYDQQRGQFLDWGLHSEAVELRGQTVVTETGEVKTVMVRDTLEPPTRQYVPAFGYVSLFPLLMMLLPPESNELGQQLQLMRQEPLLWTPYGLRSLATTSSIYKKYNTEHDPPYWRGQIWININYLALRALHHYSKAPGPHSTAAQQVYKDLRHNLLEHLVGQYQSSGYLWEQYIDTSGQGLSSHPFTGWTALLTLVAAEIYN